MSLSSIAIPNIGAASDSRIAPHELVTYRVRATVRQIISESDGDWHIVLGDLTNPARTMIAEIPSPDCAATSLHRQWYLAARDSLRRVPRNGTATFVGVGFFDSMHNQRGRAQNGFELHPIVFIAR